MITLEIPLWLLIVIVVMFCLITIHLIIGDLLAKIFYKIIKEKDKNRALEIIKNKPFNNTWFVFYKDYDEYCLECEYADTSKRLTEEEWNLLKEVLL